MYFEDVNSHHPWQDSVLMETTEEINASLAGLLYKVFLKLWNGY